jgi:hypothetical protein
MFRYQFEHREPTLMTGLIFTLMSVAILFATSLWKDVFRL